MGLKLDDIGKKIFIPKLISGGNAFYSYGSQDDFINGATYVGHFLIVYHEFNSLNYLVFRRCSAGIGKNVNIYFYSQKDDSNRRDIARSKLIEKINNYEMGDNIAKEVEDIYRKADNFFADMRKERFGNVDSTEFPFSTADIFGLHGLSSYRDNINILQEKTASLYILLQRLAQVYDLVSRAFAWEDVIEDPYW